MDSRKSAILLLLLVSLVSAFDATQYLYPTEEDVTISYTNFTIAKDTYSIVSIEGEETFLLKKGEPMSDKKKIEEVLYAYYSDKYYPTDEEIEELRDLIRQFNESRNDGYDWKNKEEYLCRNEILFANGKITMNGKPVKCIDEESCEQNAMLLFAAYGDGLGLGSVEPLYDAIYEFAPASFAMDWLLGNYTQMLNNLTEDNIVETIDYIKDTADDLKKYSETVEKTIFRTPRLDDEDDRDDCYLRCFAICPSFDLDQSAAQDLKEAAQDLSDKIEPLADYVDLASEIYERSVARINYATTESAASRYADEFALLSESGNKTIILGKAATTRVLDTSLQGKVDQLETLHVSIPEDIEIRDFSTVEGDLNAYEDLIADITEKSAAVLEVYNQTRNAKNMANSLLVVLETKDLDPVSMTAFELLKNDTADLDAKFRDGLTVEELADLEQEYLDLIVGGKKLLRKESQMPATRVLVLFRGFARNVNEGIASVAQDTNVIAPQEIPDNSMLILGLFSAVLFLSLASILLLLFLYVMTTSNFVIPKTSQIVAAAFVSLFVLLLGFSIFTYMFLTKTSSDATLTEFMADFDSKNSTAIVVDLTGTSYSDSVAMNACASSLADVLEDQNKSWTIYRITASSCIKSTPSVEQTLSVSECWEMSDNEMSLFELGYSPSNEPPKFSVIYENKAQIRANLDYYDSCPLVALFS